MAELLPFHGLIPAADKASMVAAVPYDVVDSAEAAVLAGDNMLSFLRVSRPEIELAPGIDVHDDCVYAKAAENFRRLCAEAPLATDPERHLYVYALQMGDHVQAGIIGAASVEEYNNNIVRKHEKTRKDKEDDRTRHVMTLRSHTGPVFLTCRDNDAVQAAIEFIMTTPPLFDFTAPDGIGHRLWRIGKAESLAVSRLFDSIPCIYIADGHHRAAAAGRAAAEMKAANPNHTGKEEYNYFLAVVFPASQLRILPYNRVVQDLGGNDTAAFIGRISEKFTVSPGKRREPSRYGEICMYLEGKWYTLTPKFDITDLGVIERLDVSILQDNILSPVLGIEDPRTSERISFVGGIRGVAELEKLVDCGKFKVAFSMFPTTVGQMMDIADAGEIMPPKSTWFEPKLRDGLVCHNF